MNNSYNKYLLSSLLLIILLCSSATTLAKEYLSVKLSGVDKRLATNIHAHLGTLPTTSAQRRAFIFNAEKNVTSALHSLGYYHGVIKSEVDTSNKDKWILSLAITLGKPTLIQWVDIQLAGEILTDPVVTSWLDEITIKPGDQLDHGLYDRYKTQLFGLALTRGYFDGKYLKSSISINRDLNLAQISLHYDSGKRYKIGEVNFSGHTLNDDIVEKLIPFELGIPYSTSDLNNLNKEILQTNYFANIKVFPQIDNAQRYQIPINVELSPRPSHSIELGFGVEIGNTVDNDIEPRVKITWRTPQINRYGHFQETRIEWSETQPKFVTTYSIPLTHPLDDQLKISFGLLRDKYGLIQEYNPDDQQYEYLGELEGSKGFISIARQQTLTNNWLFNYSIEWMEEEYFQNSEHYKPNFLLFGTSISSTFRGDNTLDPSSGFFQFYGIEYADQTLGSTITLTRLQTKYKWIATLVPNHRLVSRLDIGVNITDEENISLIPPSLRYFAGGDQSIRGYSHNELGPHFEYIDENGTLIRQVVGGRYLLVGSVEYQYYLTDSWRLGTFIDGGNAFDVEQAEPIFSVGGGIHWISPIGPIKLDIGVGLEESDTLTRPWRIHLTMGAEL